MIKFYSTPRQNHLRMIKVYKQGASSATGCIPVRLKALLSGQHEQIKAKIIRVLANAPE
jgi:hypothetical protein